MGHVNAGENMCVIERDGAYEIFHSPKNGIGLLRSKDLLSWKDTGIPMTLEQAKGNWAKGRLTACMVLDSTSSSQNHKYLVFFHATSPGTKR